ncbi:MAG: hypothetical protein GEV00_23525, partial [Actinophytocola sp.]|nr:hypothetical protein [Actinophytocola sp.]
MTQTAPAKVVRGRRVDRAGAPSSKRRERGLAIAMVLPAVVIVAGVYAYPAVATAVYSFARLDVATFGIERFVGLSHYLSAIQDPAFLSITLRTTYFGIALTVTTIVFSFLIALLLNQDFRGRGIVRVVVLLPWAVPPIVGGVLWVQMFHAEFGFINGLIRAFGGAGDIIWLGRPDLALHAVL